MIACDGDDVAENIGESAAMIACVREIVTTSVGVFAAERAAVSESGGAASSSARKLGTSTSAASAESASDTRLAAIKKRARYMCQIFFCACSGRMFAITRLRLPT